MIDNININEKELFEKNPHVLELLLLDNTTKKNIIWATDSYKNRGYYFNDHITIQNIIGKSFITPRSKKAKAEREKRSKDNAEVFTPSWMCNKQNNLIDEAWFGRKNVFNEEKDTIWVRNDSKISFANNKTWKDYIADIRLEISCGEAPYLASRYDTVSGEPIALKNRIGLLDRKFRIINENASTDEEWIEYSLLALKSIYGYEWQGDNLLLARENILFTYIDYFCNRFNKEPDSELLIKVSEIISWNLFQMDGIKCVIPNSCKTERLIQCNLFGEEEVIETGCDGCLKNNVHAHNGIYVKIMDWEKGKPIKFESLIRGGFFL